MSLAPAYVLLCSTTGCHARMVFPTHDGTHPEQAQTTARTRGGWTITDTGNQCSNCSTGRPPVPATCPYCNGHITYDGHRHDRCESCGTPATA